MDNELNIGEELLEAEKLCIKLIKEIKEMLEKMIEEENSK